MAININSLDDCMRRYLDYHCYGNTMNTTPQEMGMITQAWSDKIPSWQESVCTDENDYEFDDSDYEQYIDDGRNAAAETTGYNGNTGGMITRGSIDGVVTVAGGLANTALNPVVDNIAEKALVKGFGQNVGTKAATKIAEKQGSEAAKKVSDAATSAWIITAPLAAATAASYLIKKPNKEQKEACDALQPEMTGAQSALSSSQSEMAMMSSEISTLADEADAFNEDTNDQLEERKTEYDMYMETYLAIQAKIDAGEPLSESERELYEEVVAYLMEAGVLIEETSEEATDEVGNIYDEILSYQSGYDTVAENMGQIEGLTDYAAGFDQTTQTMCYVEGGAQSLNALSASKSAAQAGKFAASGGVYTSWAWLFVGMAAGGAAGSGIAASQQFSWAGEVGTEIDMRKATQDFNAETMGVYTQEIDGYDASMHSVEDLELEIPDDVEAPEAVTLPPEPTGEDAVPDALKPPLKEDEEERG